MKNMYASDRHVLFEDDKEYKSSSLFIEAGAGAGKSTSMVGRIVYQLKQGIKPERFVVITFTNKSAEDMLGKINEAIEEEAKKEDDPILKIGEVKDNPDVAMVTTKFKIGDGQESTITLLGPTRMDYDKALSALEYLSDALNKYFNDLDGGDSNGGDA